jgi:hypothetical protein
MRGSLAGEHCVSIQRRAITSKLPTRQRAANFSSDDERHKVAGGYSRSRAIAAIHLTSGNAIKT